MFLGRGSINICHQNPPPRRRNARATALSHHPELHPLLKLRPEESRTEAAILVSSRGAHTRNFAVPALLFGPSRLPTSPTSPTYSPAPSTWMYRGETTRADQESHSHSHHHRRSLRINPLTTPSAPLPRSPQPNACDGAGFRDKATSTTSHLSLPNNTRRDREHG